MYTAIDCPTATHLAYSKAQGKMNKGTASSALSTNGSGANQLGSDRIWLAVFAIVLTAAIFATDLWLPAEISVGILYALPIALCWRSEGRLFILLFGGLATLLIVANFHLSPAAGTAWAAIGNRGIALFAIGLAVMIFTLEKGARNTLIQANEGLKGRITAQAAELQKNRESLARAERLAAIGQLTGTVAHELRNPLGVIMTSIAVIETRSREADLDVEAALTRASRSIKRCESIITEHLDFARAKGHQPVALIMDYWLSGLLDEMPLTGNIVLNRDLRTGGAVVRFDPETLRRAIINLVDNACQAIMGESDNTIIGRLSVTSRVVDGEVEITVADNGPGIPPDMLTRITEPLFSTKAKGNGFGLPTVQRIMDIHGGSLKIDSTPGQGTRVVLRLPYTGQP